MIEASRSAPSEGGGALRGDCEPDTSKPGLKHHGNIPNPPKIPTSPTKRAKFSDVRDLRVSGNKSLGF